MRAIELFAGAGGLALGTSDAGFDHIALLEWNANACSTLRNNPKHWNVIECDVRGVDFRQFEGIDLVAGGPPCQPFSLGGKHRGWDDRRDMFPQAIRAVREIRPRAFLFENVRGLSRKAFSAYVEYIILQLTYPSFLRLQEERWQEHLGRLEQHHTGTGGRNPEYKVIPPRILNSADFGIPQRRERIFFIGFRADVDACWSFPEKTHSMEKLLFEKWISNEYWDKRGIKPTQEKPSEAILKKIRYADLETCKAWRTLRDAISDLPHPLKTNDILNHEFRSGARPYPGHSGSDLDEPAKTLKAGDHGVPGGENMIAFPDKTYRYLTIRESARVQTFPDWYVFEGSWSEAMRQLGNAVPVNLAASVAQKVKVAIAGI